jgi:hypothetical protein
MTLRHPPGNGEGHSPRRPQRVNGPQPVPDQTQCKPSRTTTPNPARIIHRAQAIVDTAALLALDLASIASESGRARHARAALHLRDATYHVWRAAEALLAEGEVA